MADRGKEGNRQIQKIEYTENEKSFSDEIKSIFHNFLRAIIWLKKVLDLSFKNESSFAS